MLKSQINASSKGKALDLLPVVVAIHDKDHNIIWINKEYEKATGLSQKEVEGQKCYSVWGLSEPCQGCPVISAIKTGRQEEAELTPENQDHWTESQGSWLSKAIPLRDLEGNIVGALEAAFDITEQKRAEAAAKELARFPAENPNPVLRFAKDGTILYANGASRPCLSTWKCEQGHCMPNDWVQYVSEVLESGKPKEIEVTCEDQIFALVIAPVSGTQYVNAYGLDVTYRKTVEKALLKSVETLEFRVSERTAELKAAYEQRDYLSRKLVDLLERERTEIGWTLHEQLAQILAGAGLQLEGLKTRLQKEKSACLDKVEHIQELLRDAILEAKDVSHMLRSDTLETLGLVPAIRNLAEKVKMDSSLAIFLTVWNLGDKINDTKTALTVYRLIQEALTNVKKHAQAKNVYVNLDGRDGRLVLTIEDDGVGFDYGSPSTRGDKSRCDPLGLTIMRERVAMLDGAFRVESVPGKGTSILADIPMGE